MIGLNYEGTENYSYFDAYLEKFLNPVYEVKVDNVAILKVWKNDEEHLKISAKEIALNNVGYTKSESGILFDIDESGITFDIGDIKKISRLEIDYSEKDCRPLKTGFVQLSVDGENYEQQWGALPVEWRVASLKEQPREGHFVEPFIGKDARFIRLVLNPTDTCLKNVENYKIYVFE